MVVLLIVVACWRFLKADLDAGQEEPRTPAASPGALASVRIGKAGDVHVVMTVHFAVPQREVTLQVPRRTGIPGGFDQTVQVLVLRVEVDGRAVDLAETLGVGETLSLPPEVAVDQVLLEYAATGTFAASAPSKPGRGLVLLTPLAVVESDVTLRLKVADVRVLNLGCAHAGQMRPCGSRSHDRWVVAPIAEHEDVVAQVDLLRARTPRN